MEAVSVSEGLQFASLANNQTSQFGKPSMSLKGRQWIMMVEHQTQQLIYP